MKLAIYHPWIKDRGGAEKVVLEYAKNSEHDVTVVTLFYDEEATFEGFKDLNVQIIGSNKPPSSFIDKGMRFGLGAMFQNLSLKDKYDALIVSEAGIGSLITIRNHDVPILAYVHTPLRPALPEFRNQYREEKSSAIRPVYDIGIRFYSLLEKIGWSYFDEIVANSKLTKDRIVSKGLAEPDNVDIVNPGAEIVEDVGEYQKYFFYPSRFRKYKRQHLAIEAFKEADLDDFKLVLAGSGQEKEYLNELRGLANENVEFRTDVPENEWKDLYRNAYSVLFLAEKEDWGIVPIEAGMHGKSVIAVNEGSPSESVKNGETGYLVEADAAEIAEKMKYLANNHEKNREIGEKGREESKKFSWSNFGKKLDEKLKDVLE